VSQTQQPMNWVLEYTRQINNGQIITSKRVKVVFNRLAGEIRHSKTHERSKYIFDEDRGNWPIEFIERFCRQSEGEYGAPIRLELFQKAIIQAAFGFLHRDTRLRRFRELFWLLGRKNGKTTLAAALALYLMIADGEGAAKIFALATKRDQAAIAVDAATDMRRHSSGIAAITKKRRNDIYYPETSSFFKALTSESSTSDGLNVHGAIIDELHAIRDRKLYDNIKQGTSNRRQPMIIIITTAGDVRENIYDHTYEKACKIADGEETQETFLPIIYELDERDEWTDPRMWIKANPGLGTIKMLDTLQGFVDSAKLHPEEVATVLCKDFNLRVSNSEAWLPYEDIDSDRTFDMSEVYNTYAVGGCDLSATTDLTCATLLIRRSAEDKTVYVLQHYFIPEERVKRVDEMTAKEAPYRTWAEQGLITICSGSRVDYKAVTGWFCQMRDKYKIDVVIVGYDQAFAGYWVPEMEANGFKMEQVIQGAITFSQPMREMGAAFSDKIINYNKNKILFWCMTNTRVRKSGHNNIKPEKIGEKKRIDGAMSLLDAWVIYIRHFDDYMYLVG